MPLPTNSVDLVLWLVNLGVTLSEQDQEKIRAGVSADKEAADAVTEKSREQDAPRE